MNKFITKLIIALPFSFFLAQPITFDIDDLWDLDAIAEMEQETTTDCLRIINNNLNDLLRIFLKDIEEPLWNDTKPPKGRDVLHLIPYKMTSIEYGGLSMNLFFNMTNHMNVTARTSLNLNTEDTLKNIDAIIKAFLDNNGSSSDMSGLASLFRNITIQERKIGGLIQAGFLYGPFNIQMHTSIQISERNFWLSKKDQARIASLFEEEGQQFDQKELYKTKFGIGDTRIKLGLNTINLSSFAFDIGFEGIIPTGGRHKLETDIDYDYLPDTEEELQSWAVENTQIIRDNLITPRLGNNGHFGLGFFMESKIALFHNAFNLWNRISFDTILEGNEWRLMLFQKTIDNENLHDDDNQKFTENLAKFIRENIFPYPFKVRIKPGNIINFVSAINFNINKRWQCGLGYDLYLQNEEIIEKIFDKYISFHALRVEEARSKKVIQHKVFTDTTYRIKHPTWDMLLGIGGDLTFDSRNIGKDWTLYFKIGASF